MSVPATRLAQWLQNFTARHPDVGCLPGDTQFELSSADGTRAWITVPFGPLPGVTSEPLAELVSHTERPRRIGVLLVRRGGHAAGVFQGADLISSKVGSRYVQGTTKAGGWSQQRYARRRGNQARAAFADAADAAVRILAPEAPRLEALICGGDKAAVAAVLADERLAALRPLASGRLLAVPDPRLRILQALPEKFLSVQIAVHP